MSENESHIKRTSDTGNRPHGGIMVYSVASLTPEQEINAFEQQLRWKGDMERSKDHPMGRLADVKTMLLRLNMIAERTGYKFHLFPLIDMSNPSSEGNLSGFEGTTDPEEVRLANSHEETQLLLVRMPEDVRFGRSREHRGYQIRLNDFGSLEYQMDITTHLINTFASLRADGLCHMLPDDVDSHTNWDVLQRMYSDHFPSTAK